jgi:hypothetical protein
MTSPKPTNQILLHIGVPKTGTTALQAALASSRKELTKQNVLYPSQWRNAHHRAAWAVTEKTWGWKGRGGTTTPIKHWNALVRETKKNKSVVLSSEFFCEANESQVKKIVSDLTLDRLQVVITLRPFGKLLPSAWQQYLKYGVKLTYPQWLTAILQAPRSEAPTPTFWMRHDHPALIKKWIEFVGKDRITLVVVDENNHDFIYQAFENLLSLSAGTLVKKQDKVSNRSMTLAETELLRQINLSQPDGSRWDKYESFVRRSMMHEILNSPIAEPNPQKVTTPGWAADIANKISIEYYEAIRQFDLKIIGDINALKIPTEASPEQSLPEVISIATVAIGMQGVQKNGLRRLPFKSLFAEIKRRIKNRINR